MLLFDVEVGRGRLLDELEGDREKEEGTGVKLGG